MAPSDPEDLTGHGPAGAAGHGCPAELSCADVERQHEIRARAWEAEMLARLDVENERLHRRVQIDRWAAAVSGALDDVELANAVRRLTRPIEGLDRRSAPAVRAALLSWASHTASRHPTLTLHDALTAELADGPMSERVPERLADHPAPAAGRPAIQLSARLRVLLPRLDRQLEPPGHELSL